MGSDHHDRKRRNQIVIERGDEPDVSFDADDFPEIVPDRVQPPPQSRPFVRLALKKRNRLGVFPDAHQRVTQIGLFDELPVIESGKALSDVDRDH